MVQQIHAHRNLTVESVRPVADYLFIKTIRKLETAGGILIAGKDGVKSECLFGRVIAVGTGECDPVTGRSFGCPYAKDDVLLFMAYAGFDLKIQGEEYRFIREHGVWARVQLADDKTCDVKTLDPVTDHVLLELDESDTLESGLYVPKAQVAGAYARVVSVGRGKRFGGVIMPVDLNPGDRVAFMRYAGAEIDLNGKRYRLVDSGDIYSVVP